MRKFITLCAVALMSLSSMAFAQTSVEDDIIAVIATAGDAAAAYDELLSEDNTVLTAEQKAALAALGPVAGAAFLDAIAKGNSISDAATVAIALGTTPEAAGEVIAKLSTFEPGSGDNGADTTDSLLTQTAAGSTGDGTAPIGSGSTGTGGGTGGGGSTASGN